MAIRSVPAEYQPWPYFQWPSTIFANVEEAWVIKYETWNLHRHETELKYSAAWKRNVKDFTVTEVDWLTGNGGVLYSTWIKTNGLTRNP